MKKAGPEIRALAVRAVESGQFTVRQIAELTNYTVATVYNWLHAVPAHGVSAAVLYFAAISSIHPRSGARFWKWACKASRMTSKNAFFCKRQV